MGDKLHTSSKLEKREQFMNDSVQTFSYTAKRTSYLATVGALLFLMGIESSVVTLLVIVLIHSSLLRFALPFVLVCFLAFIAARLIAPLRTQHKLSQTQLSLRYGAAFKADILRGDILDAQAVREQLTLFQPITPQYEEKKQRIIASFSEQGQVLLRLNKPHTFKVGNKAHFADTLLINVDRRDEFLRALGSFGNQEDLMVGRDRCIAASSAFDTPRGRDTSVPTEAFNIKNTTPAIRIEGLTRRFGTYVAVDKLHMTIQPGEIYGFLGSNGAGKTTTMKMLVSLLQPNEGRAWLAGHDIERDALAAKTALGYVADKSILYERLTGREFLLFLSQIRNIPLKNAQESIAHLLEVLELTDAAEQMCSSYSFGMKRKLSLAGALLHQPPVLILDEPLNGLDPQSSRNLKDLLLDLAAHGTAILLSTHNLATAEAICHRIGILYKGRLLAEGSVSELCQHVAASDLETVFLTLTAQAKEAITL